MKINLTCARLLVSSLVAITSIAAAALPSGLEDSSPPAQTASLAPLDELKAADKLESSRIGFAALLSPRLQQLMQVLEAPDAVDQLQELYAEGTLAGKMYALIGLQLLDEPTLESDLLADASQHAEEMLAFFEGCVIREEAVGKVLPRIADGSLSDSFKQDWQRSQQD